MHLGQPGLNLASRVPRAFGQPSSKLRSHRRGLHRAGFARRSLARQQLAPPTGQVLADPHLRGGLRTPHALRHVRPPHPARGQPHGLQPTPLFDGLTTPKGPPQFRALFGADHQVEMGSSMPTVLGANPRPVQLRVPVIICGSYHWPVTWRPPRTPDHRQRLEPLPKRHGAGPGGAHEYGLQLRVSWRPVSESRMVTKRARALGGRPVNSSRMRRAAAGSFANISR